MISQKNRSGYSKITSVSVSNEMIKLIEQYNLSPTEVFRRGMGVMLYDLGIEPYVNSITNRDRSDYVKKFMDSLAKSEELVSFNESLKIIEDFNIKAARASDAFDNVNRILKKIGAFK